MGGKPAYVYDRLVLNFEILFLNINMNENQVPLWINENNETVIDSSTPIMESPSTRVSGYDQNGIPRSGIVLSKFVSEGTQYTAIRADDGQVYTITTSILLG